MNQHTYLSTLKHALTGLPADQIDDIVSDYRQHFADGRERGRNEEEIGKALGEPRKIAAEFKAMTHVDAFQHQRSLGNFGRMALAVVGLAGFNLFVLPVLLIAPILLLCLYLLSVSSLFGGSVIAASGALDLDAIALDQGDQRKRLEVVNFFYTGDTRNSMRQQNMHVGFEVPPFAVVYREGSGADAERDTVKKAPLSRLLRIVMGIFYVAVGLGLFVLSRKLKRLTWAGLKRYVHAQGKLLIGTQQAYG